MAPDEPWRPQSDEARGAAVPLSEEDCARLRHALAQAVRRTCPRWLAGQADDIVQVALAKVVELCGEGRDLQPAYLWRVAYSATVDEIRRHRRRREVGLEEAQGGAAGAGGDPERAAAARELGRAFRDCLRGLVEPRRLAVALHLHGHSVPEAARILGWGGKRVENLVYRGLSDLRRCLTLKGLHA